MRFASLNFAGKERVGIVENDEVLLLPEGLADVADFIALGGDGRDLVAKLRRGDTAPRVALAQAVLLAPVRRFRRDIMCTGWNYWDHFEEGRGKREGQEVDRPKAPTFFSKGPGTVIGPTDDIAFDARISAKWDYEAELALVIGRAGRSIPASQALDHVFGYFLANDVSQRDLQRRHGGQWLKGKSIDDTMPMGPTVVTEDELEVPEIRLECLLNGQVMQSALVKQMAFSIPELIAELSFGMTLMPGDVIITGTPAGVGNAREPQIFMKAGDHVLVRGTGLGELSNRLVSRDLYGASDVPAMSAS
ncbi:fumarylacetoacetate hydrolase family protein [Bradyrhizobium sp. CCBAU 53338]|uniref:fumarylacetoacetate hydrolase family protein n=1 Tax=Bradyrhizobium sp. CCBAU 53338 TaxID=1325111 RepID=UPI00188BF9CD|nr:fumarylacetoacetate hydrolase family protein [Bradyrhizobium sp. CCBAU 53338]QOZ52516.1 5-carboxymethyl-2-hydroxymuconate isomerase [Bradyrhizobium sp. CCBAU 53338]